MAGIIQSCPYCGEKMGAYAGLHSGLGPSTIGCDVTGQPIRTGRREWSEMGTLCRAWYILCSVLYAIIIGAWGLLMTGAILNPNLGSTPGKPVEVAPLGTRILLLCAFGVFCAAGLALQYARIQGSLKRTSGRILLTHRTATRYLYGQISAIFLMLIVGLVIVFGSKWIHSLVG